MFAKVALGIVLVIVLVAGTVYYLLVLEPRPEDTTAARVYLEDAYAVDYCQLPELDGSGLTADEIPKSYTPNCEIDRWPAPILAGCTEPLPPHATDLRGLWREEQASAGRSRHIERIEQCGNRLIVVSSRVTHDFRTNGTLADGANDINPALCTRVRAAVEWNEEGTLVFRAWGLVKVVTRSLADADTLVWEYPGRGTSVLKRICRLPGAAAPDAVGDTLSRARAGDGYISWREHRIDDSQLGGVAISGSDGLVLGDLDGDGFDDIVSVHESDTSYDGQPDGHVRIAFGSTSPSAWHSITLAQGVEAAAPEDAAIADVNGDGFADVIVASELAHLLYLQNPGSDAREAPWPRLILPASRDRGSWLRVFFADFDGDGRPEVSSPNKGSQNPGEADLERLTAVSVFRAVGDPLAAGGWEETELGRFRIPQNAQAVDIDGDGDMDIVAGSRGENRLILFENVGGNGELRFAEHAVRIGGGAASGGFNLDYADLDRDGRLDIVAAFSTDSPGQTLGWIAQPASFDGTWTFHPIGTFHPDSMTGLAAADVNGDGHLDVMAGSYSWGPRDRDGDVGVGDALGRLGWFENPGNASGDWTRHDISRRTRGMFDKFVPRDLDGDGDVDFVGTRGNSAPFDGVFWLEQVRTPEPMPAFRGAWRNDSAEMPLPTSGP